MLNWKTMRSCERKSVLRCASEFAGARRIAATALEFFKPLLPVFAIALLLGVLAPHVSAHVPAGVHGLPLMGMGVKIGNTHDGPQNRTTIQFGAINAQRVIQVDKSPGAFLRYGILHMNGSVVVSAGTANGTATGENAAAFLQQVRYNASTKGYYPGGDIIRLGPRSLVRARLFDKSNVVTDAAINGAAATYTIDMPLWLRFQRPDSPRSFDSALPMDGYQAHSVIVTNGSRDTAFTGNDRTFDFTGLNYDWIDSREVQVQGTQDKTVVFMQDDDYLIPAANKRFVINTFPVDGNIIDVTLFTETTNQALANTILNNCLARYGGIQFFNLKGSQIQRVQRDRFYDSSQTTTGIYNIGFNEDQLQLAGLEIDQLGDLALELDVANPGGANVDKVKVMTERAFPSKTAVAAATAAA